MSEKFTQELNPEIVFTMAEHTFQIRTYNKIENKTINGKHKELNI